MLGGDAGGVLEAVRRRVRDAERALDVVRAVLEASGRPVHMDRAVAVRGDTVEFAAGPVVLR